MYRLAGGHSGAVVFSALGDSLIVKLGEKDALHRHEHLKLSATHYRMNYPRSFLLSDKISIYQHCGPTIFDSVVKGDYSTLRAYNQIIEGIGTPTISKLASISASQKLRSILATGKMPFDLQVKIELLLKKWPSQLTVLGWGPSHNDLTLTNILFNGLDFTLIDPASSYLNNFSVDTAKIRQELVYGWSYILAGKEHLFDPTNRYFLEIVNAIKLDDCDYFDLINVCRIIPYATSGKIKQRLVTWANEISTRIHSSQR